MDDRTEELRRTLDGARAYINTLPDVERRMATLAADGTPVWEIAQQTGASDAAVWRTLDGVITTVTGRQRAPVETGGFGSDTDPGVTGGYGNTGFGAFATEPPVDPTEPVPDSDEPVLGNSQPVEER